LHDDVAFAEFNRNPNFVHYDILPDFVTRSKNYENCSHYRINFVRDGIVDSSIE